MLKLSISKSASLNCLKGRQTVSQVVSHSKLPGDIVNEPVRRSEIPLKKIHIFTSQMSRGTQCVSCTAYVKGKIIFRVNVPFVQWFQSCMPPVVTG